MVIVNGKFGISARVLLHSVTTSGINLVTFENEKPRLILSEENTHRSLSKNSASSRAIPFKKMAEQLTARPVRFGQANPGMQDKGEEYTAPVISPFTGHGYHPAEAWEMAKGAALEWSRAFYNAGYHKQVYIRLTEAFQMMKRVQSGTEWANFFWLRDDDAADPTIAELARCQREALEQSTPFLLYPGEWHLPYVERKRGAFDGDEGTLYYGDYDDNGEWINYSLDDAIKISAARCAAVSFRNVDYGIEKSREVHARLVGDERKHASALEHQATPIAPRSWDIDMEDGVNIPTMPITWEDGVSHMDKKSQLWSGNFRGWVQYRKLIPGENKAGYSLT
jgi:hypothetical protein